MPPPPQTRQRLPECRLPCKDQALPPNDPTPTALPAPPTSTTAAVALPWRGGDVASGWTVARTDRFPDHVVVHLTAGARDAGVEVVLRGPTEDEWTAGKYRVQPAPGRPPVEEAVAAWRDFLRHQPADAPAFLVRPEVGVAHPDARQDIPAALARAPGAGFMLSLVRSPGVAQGQQMAEVATVSAHLFALALCGALVVRWLRRNRQHVRTVVGALGLSILGLVLLQVLLPPARIPLSMLTVLHEGQSDQNLQHLYGVGAHTGPVWPALVSAIAPIGPKLRHVVHFNLQLWWLQAVFLGAMARVLTASWPRVLLSVALFAGTLGTVHGALSELPAMLLSVYFCMGIVAGVVLRHEPPGWSLSRGLALTLYALLTGLALLVRPETSVLVGPVLAWELAHAIAPAWTARWLEVLRTQALRALNWAPHVLIPLAVLSVLAWDVGEVWVPASARWALNALHPFNPATLAQPLAMAAFAPVTAAILATAGAWWLWRDGGASRVALLGFLLLFRTYFSASHTVMFELLRYTTLLSAPVAWLGVHGWLAWDEWLAARSPVQRNVARLALGLGCIAWLPHGQIDRFVDMPGLALSVQEGSGPRLSHFLVQRDVQREVRFLQSAMERHPACLFVARGGVYSLSKPKFPDAMITVGMPLATATVVPAAQWTPQRLRREALAEWSCVYYYRSLTCNQAGIDPCANDVPGIAAEEEEVFTASPYNDAFEWGAPAPQTRIGLYPLHK